MRKVDDGKRKEKRKEKKRMAFLVATTSLPAVYRPNGYARTTTAGTPHARAKKILQQKYGVICSVGFSFLEKPHSRGQTFSNIFGLICSI